MGTSATLSMHGFQNWPNLPFPVQVVLAVALELFIDMERERRRKEPGVSYSFARIQTCDRETAIAKFLLHMEATREANTLSFYDVQLRTLRSWTESESVAFGDFRKKYLDRFIVFWTGQGMKPTTVHDGAASTKKLFRRSASNELPDRCQHRSKICSPALLVKAGYNGR